jgi:hypothetical protein
MGAQMAELDTFAIPEPGTVTRGEYYRRDNGQALEPEPEQLEPARAPHSGSAAMRSTSEVVEPARVCRGCGTSLEGKRADAVWCSNACKKRAGRRNGSREPGTSSGRAPPARREARASSPPTVKAKSSAGARARPQPDDAFLELLTTLAGHHALPVVAVTLEYEHGLRLSISRAETPA